MSEWPEQEHKAIFRMGRIIWSAKTKMAFLEAGDNPFVYLFRHHDGDWGDICEEDQDLNDQAVLEGTRIVSSYSMKNGTQFWILTEADRSSTTFLLPSEY